MLPSLGLTVIPGVVAVVFEPLPERIDPFYAVLTSAGFGSLLGSVAGVLTHAPAAQRAAYAERFSIVFALAGLAGFVFGWFIQAVT